MSASIIEHVVLFKLKDETEPSKATTIVDRVNALISLDQVLHIAMGPVLHIRSSSLSFTHTLHSRYKSKDDLDAYTMHPRHVIVAKSNAQNLDDMMALDWIVEDLQGDLVLPPRSAVRVTFLKLKENLGDEVKNEILGVLRGIRDNFKQINQFTYGENISPGRAKGFSIGSLAVFPGLSEMEEVDLNEQFMEYQKDKVGQHLENMIVVDYIVPSIQAQYVSIS